MASLSQHRAPHLTRRGSLAYYLAAWVCGGFFVALALFAAAQRAPDSGLTPDTRGFLAICFFTLIYGWLPAVVFAFLLRRIARALEWERPWPWAISGGVLMLTFTLGLSFLSNQWASRYGTLRFLKELLELGGENGVPLTSQRAIAGLGTILAGMGLGYVLFRIDRAFARPEDSSN